jgi:hypothetical protein
MKRLTRLILLAALLPRAVFAQDLETILQKNSAALGGEDNWARIENVRFELAISEPGLEVTGTYVATRDGSMRIDIEADGQRVFSEGLDLGRAWQWTPGDGVKPSGEAGAQALRHGIVSPGRFFTLGQARARGARISLADTADETEWRLRVTLADGSAHDYFIDRKTFLPTRDADNRAFHPDLDATEVLVESRYSDPRWVDGVLRFARTDNVNLDTGEWLGTTIARSMEHNIEIPEGYFRPE